MCAHLMRLWLGMGYRAAWCFRDVSRDAKGLGTSSKLCCYVGLRIVTLSKNLIKYENRYSQIFNIGCRELHATYMDFLFYFVFNDPPQPAPQIKWQFLYPTQPETTRASLLFMERTWLTFHCWLYTLYIIVYVTNKNLESWILNLIGSQYRDCKIGVIWSYFLDLVRTLAAAFCTICSLFIEDAGQPPSSALQ